MEGVKMILMQTWERRKEDLMNDLRSGMDTRFKTIFLKMHFYYQVLFFERLNQNERRQFYQVIGAKECASFVSKLTLKKQSQIIAELPEMDAVNLVNHLPFTNQIEFLRSLTDKKRTFYLSFMKRRKVRKLKMTLLYDVNTAGSLLSPEFISATENETVAIVFKRIIEESKDKRMIQHVFIVSVKNQLIGVVPLQKLLGATEVRLMKDLMDEKLISVTPKTKKRVLEKINAQYNIDLLPVVTKENGLIGVVNMKGMRKWQTKPLKKSRILKVIK